VASAVVDTSALVALGQLDLLHLLPDLFGEVLLPGAVRREALERREDAPGAATIERAVMAGELRVQRVSSPAVQPAWSRSLGSGETEVIRLALELGADFVVLDDLAARRIADGLGLRVIGTVGILLLARRAGKLTTVLPLIERLRTAGFRLSDDVIDAIRTEEG
jgi:predicted nucleic acid-binding protein